MNSKAAYVLVFILVVGFCQGYAQHAETNEPVQSGVAKDIQYAKEKAGELQNKVFVKVDSSLLLGFGFEKHLNPMKLSAL